MDNLKRRSLLRILLTLLLCSLLFVGAFTACAYVVLKLTFAHVNWVGGGSTPLEPGEAVGFWICVAGVVASFTIHPWGAYLVRRDIRQLTSSATLRTVTFVIFAGFQVCLLILAYGAWATKSYIDRQRTLKLFRAHQEVVATLDNAKVDVIAKHARVISDDGKFVLAEVTLQIRNVPFSTPNYEMNIHAVGPEESFREMDRSIINPYLTVTNRNNKWIFHDKFTKRDISDNADNVVVRVEFSRVNAAEHELPKTITPRLGIWARDDKVYYGDHLFFHKPIPVSFEK